MGNSRALQKANKELSKAKAPGKPRDIIYDPMGQWKHPGENTRIPGGDITMQGVPYPVYAQPNIGQPQMMYPGQDYNFPGADYVDEYPQMKRGGYIKGLVQMPKPSKKGLASKAYSRSLEATNRLFTENRLFEKPKSRKRKVFDPHAKYYTEGGANEDMSVITNPQDLDPETLKKYLKELKNLENSVKAGYKKGKWYPHRSFEGGSDTIAYGHKLMPGEDYSSGISDQKAAELQKNDVLEKQKVAESFVDKKYGKGTYDSLPQNSQMLLLDYTYNGVINKFPSFVKHVVEGNKEGMLKEYERGSKGRPLKERNEWAKNVIKSTDFSKPEKVTNTAISDAPLNVIPLYENVIQKMTPFQLGGGLLEAEYGMPFGSGASQNYEGRTKYKHNVGGIPNLPLRDNRVAYNNAVNSFEPMTKKQYGGEDISIPTLNQKAKGRESSCPNGYVWDGKKCIKNWIKQPSNKKASNKKEKEDKDIKDLMDYGKKTLPNKKSTNKPVKNLLVQSKDIITPEDDLLENITEFADPSGYFSWDDAERAQEEWNTSGNTLPTFTQAMDMFGAVPGLGKLGKIKYLSSAPNALKAAYKYFPWQQVVNAIDTGQDINQDNLQYKTGGEPKHVDTELTDAEIQDLIDEGYIVEIL